MFKVGDRVRNGVYVCGEYRPMEDGVVTRVCSGYCEVDVMSHRGGAPWIKLISWGELRHEEGRGDE